MEYAVGKKVRHIYTGEYLWIIRIGKEQLLCRTKDLREIWFFPYELEEVDNINENTPSLSNHRFL